MSTKRIDKINGYLVCINVEIENDSNYGVDIDGNRGTEKSWISGYSIEQIMTQDFVAIEPSKEELKEINENIESRIINGEL